MAGYCREILQPRRGCNKLEKPNLQVLKPLQQAKHPAHAKRRSAENSKADSPCNTRDSLAVTNGCELNDKLRVRFLPAMGHLI